MDLPGSARTPRFPYVSAIFECHTVYQFETYIFFWVVLQLRPPAGTWQTTKRKRREGSSRGESKRKLLKETQNQRKETRKKKKKNQVEYRVEGAQDRRRRRKPGGWKETPNTRKKGGETHIVAVVETKAASIEAWQREANTAEEPCWRAATNG